MSGIAGILQFDGRPVEPGTVEGLTTGMASLGPDGCQHWRDGAVALGHAMLRATPESVGEVQPLANEDGSLVLVLDGRLDNRAELQRTLKTRGLVLRTQTDAELVLRAYELWAEDSPQQVLGDFAYAVWDGRRRQLFCARDHLGARPFYYTRTAGIFAFASVDDALIRLPGVSSAPNEERVVDYLAPGIHLDPSRTWRRDVRALMPGESLAVSADGKLRSRTYWQPDPGEESVYGSDAECWEAFLDVFGEAVRCRMRTLGQPAAMMSGGLDSASLSAMARRLLPEMPERELHTYSAIDDEPEGCVESRCIQELTCWPGVRPRFVTVPSLRGMVNVDDLIQVAWSEPHPIDNSILLPALMCLAASRASDRVMLLGLSGDITLHVPGRYPAYDLRRGHGWRAWQACQAASRNNTYLRGVPPLRMLLLNAWTAFVPGGVKLLAHRLRDYSRGCPPMGTLIHPDLVRRSGWVERWRAQQARGAHQINAGSRANKARLVFRRPGLVHGLTGFAHMAGRHGVELRDPWADRRVVEFFLRLPLAVMARDGWTKYPVRAAFAPDLSAAVRWRQDKEHLGWKLTQRLMQESNDLVSRTMGQSLDALADYVDLDVARTEYRAYRASRSEDNLEHVFDLVTLILWLTRCSEAPGSLAGRI